MPCETLFLRNTKYSLWFSYTFLIWYLFPQNGFKERLPRTNHIVIYVRKSLFAKVYCSLMKKTLGSCIWHNKKFRFRKIHLVYNYSSKLRIYFFRGGGGVGGGVGDITPNSPDDWLTRFTHLFLSALLLRTVFKSLFRTHIFKHINGVL